MPIANFTCRVACLALLLSATGCSSLGLSLYPTGHFLTDKAEEILDRSPRSANLARELAMDVEPVHYLIPGEVLLIEPVELDSDVRIAADQKILTDGSVDLGDYGRVVVAGLTPESAEALIEDTINTAIRNRQIDKEDANDADPVRINVRVLDQVHRYYVLGEVNSPGSYPLDGNETILDGILAAGGLTDEASPCKILLARPTQPNSCRLTLPVCYREITQLGDTTTNYQLRPGDRIFVATRSCCEDLLFWRANDTCERCCNCQTACVDPHHATTGGNPMSRTVAGPIAPIATTPGMIEGTIVTNSGANIGNTALPVDDGSMFAPVEISPSDMPSFSGPAPKRLPPSRPGDGIDGELQFDGESSIDRFEPMWVQPAK